MADLKVDFEEIVTRYQLYKTETHLFKISETQLDKLRLDKDFLVKIGTRIQKTMKQIQDKSNGSEWDDSYKAIFSEITKQRTLVP